jgi:hypothetical protein
MKVIALVLLAAVLLVATALLGTIFLYFGWNYGVLAAFPNAGLGHLDLIQTFCFSLGLGGLGSVIRGASVKSSSND